LCCGASCLSATMFSFSCLRGCAHRASAKRAWCGCKQAGRDVPQNAVESQELADGQHLKMQQNDELGTVDAKLERKRTFFLSMPPLAFNAVLASESTSSSSSLQTENGEQEKATAERRVLLLIAPVEHVRQHIRHCKQAEGTQRQSRSSTSGAGIAADAPFSATKGSDHWKTSMKLGR
jgi:hypothetical protein